jgi:hypothetical protein
LYSQAAECNREEKYRMIYADQDEQRGCVKIISRTALSFMPVLISEIICGCLCLLLGLWTLYVTCHINNLRSDNEIIKVTPPTTPVTKYPHYQTVHNVVPEIDDQTNQLKDNYPVSRHSYPPIYSNKIDKSLYANTGGI